MARSWSATAIHSWKKEGRPAPDAPIPPLFNADALDAWFRDIVVSAQAMCEEQVVEALKETTQQNRRRVLTHQTQRSGGIAPLLHQTVDGHEDTTLATIKPTSVIVLIWVYTPEVAKRTYDAWMMRSPKLTGRYKEGILVFVDGAPAGFQAITIDTKLVTLVASVPYARRLELGKRKSYDKSNPVGGPFVKQVAPHIAEETAIIAKRKFSALAAITYLYSELSGAYALKRRIGFRTVRGTVQTDVRYPTINIEPRW